MKIWKTWKRMLRSVLVLGGILLPMAVLTVFAANTEYSFGCNFNGSAGTIRNFATKDNTSSLATIRILEGEFGIGSATMWVEDRGGTDLSYTQEGINSLRTLSVKYKPGKTPPTGTEAYLSTYGTAFIQSFGGRWIP